MTKKALWLAAGLLAVFFLFRTWTAHENDVPGPQGRGRTVTDMKGRSFEVKEPLERIALLGGPTGQIAFILGVQDRLCAVTNTLKMSTLIREMYPSIMELPGPRTTSGSINIEELIRSNPDIVITGDIDGNIVLEKTRIPVAFLEDSMGEGLVDIKQEIRFYGAILNAPERAERYVAFLDKITGLVKEKTMNIPPGSRKTVFQGYNPNHLVTLGGDTFMQEHIELAGCINSAESITTLGNQTGLHSGLGEVSMEQVLDWNPDILIINSGLIEDLRNDPQWRVIRAVATGQVYYQPAGVFIFNRPTAESAVVYPLWLAATAYPERFRDVCVPCLIKEFYKKVFDFDLTDTQADDILSGAYESRMMKGISHKG